MFGVVASGHDVVKELLALAELHDEMHGIVVLVGILQSHDVQMLWQVAHDLHLPPDVVNVYRRSKLLLRDRLACQLLPRLLVRTEVGYPKLAAPQLVVGLDLAVHWGLQNDELRPIHGDVKTVIDRKGFSLFGGYEVSQI